VSGKGPEAEAKSKGKAKAKAKTKAEGLGEAVAAQRKMGARKESTARKRETAKDRPSRRMAAGRAGRLPGAARVPKRESAAAKKERTAEILARLHAEYPDARCSLTHGNAYQLLVATILSAQCTDERVNQVTPALFRHYPKPVDLAHARTEELEDEIRSTGFFRNKAKSLLGMSNALVDRHDGRVPDDMDALVELPGVGRKTANVVLGNAFGKNVGVVVDTHVTRLSGRLGLTKHTDAVRIEQDLMKLVPQDEWTIVSHLFIDHGRAVCKAPTPRCEACVLFDICPSSRV
jgi:endonuclease III